MTEDIVGMWSADAMYGPGSQSDDVFVFKEDGSGFYAFSNFATSYAELFQWKLLPDDIVQLNGVRTFELNDECTSVVESNSALEVSVPFSIAHEPTKAGRWMRVLRFKNCPWGVVADHYGFIVRRIPDDLGPDFSWLERKNA